MQNYNLQNANPNIFNSNLICLLPISPSLLTEKQSPLKLHIYTVGVYIYAILGVIYRFKC